MPFGIESHIYSVRSLFNKDVSYRIPPFQRSYVWDNNNWEFLWSDFQSVLDRCVIDGRQAEPHFMGTIIIQKRDSIEGLETFRIIDGQQRLTTLQIMIKAAMDLPQFKVGANNWMSALCSNNATYTTHGSQNLLKIYQTNFDDRGNFIIIMGEFNKDANVSLTLMKRCYDFFHDHILAWIDNRGADLDDPFNVFEAAFAECLLINTIEIREDRNAYRDFEAVNNRGTDLEPNEIAKNTFMWRANIEDDEDAANRVWGMFENQYWNKRIPYWGQRKPKRIEIFLNSWIAIRSGVCPRLPKDMPSMIDTYLQRDDIDIWQVMSDLHEVAQVYRRLDEGYSDVNEKFTGRVRNFVIKAHTVWTVALWLYASDISSDTRDHVSHILDSYIVRRYLAGKSSGHLNRVFSDIIPILVESGGNTSVIKGVTRYLEDFGEWPSYDDIALPLSYYPLKASNGPAHRSILADIEDYIRPDMEEPVDMTKLTLEHIMPQRWETHWPLPIDANNDANKAKRNSHIERIGNLTLVTGKLNTTAQNRSWQEKRRLLEQSTLHINRDPLLSTSDDWNEDTIHDRGWKLVDMVVQVWPGPNGRD